MTETAQPRANREGRPCPPWCSIDHATQRSSGACIGGGGSIGEIWTRAVLGPGHDDRAAVAVTGTIAWHDGYAHFEVDPRSAMHLAGMVEALAGATPEQHRELAAAIRLAAAQITDGRDG